MHRHFMSTKRKTTSGTASGAKKTKVFRPSAANAKRKGNMTKRKFVSNYKRIEYGKPLCNNGASYMPNMFRTRFVYNQTPFDGAVPVGLGQEYIYRGNSIYDPDYTGAGTTVNGHAELGAIYNRYKVIGSRITVMFMAKTAGAVNTLHIYPARTATAEVTILPIAHHPNQVTATVYGQDTPKKLVMYSRSAQHFGSDDSNDIGLNAAWSANPTNSWYWHVGITGTSGDSVRINTVIEYYTICWDVKTTYPSTI